MIEMTAVESATVGTPSRIPKLREPGVDQRIALGLIVLLGIALRAYSNGTSLWFDETMTYWLGVPSFSVGYHLVRTTDVHSPLYYWLLKPFIAMGGSEWLLRLPATISGIASILLAWWIGKELFGRRAGLIAGLLFAVAPMQIYYSTEVRPYETLVVLSLLVLAGVLLGTKAGGVRWWAMVAVTEAAGLYVDNCFIWFLLALNVGFILDVRSRRRKTMVAFLLAQAGGALLYLPWLPTLIYQTKHNLGLLSYIQPATVGTLAQVAVELLDQDRAPLCYAAIAIIAGAWVMPLLFRKLTDAPTESRDAGPWIRLLVCVGLLPVLVPFLVSQRYVHLPLLPRGRSIFIGRQVIIATPGLLILVALGMSRLRRVPRTLALIGLVGLYLLADRLILRPSKMEDFRAAADVLRKVARPDDLVISNPAWLEAGLDYDRVRRGLPGVLTGFPRRWPVLPPYNPDPTPLDQQIRQHSRIWLISGDNSAGGLVIPGERVKSWKVQNLVLTLYEK